MPKFSKDSLEKLQTCHIDIQKVMQEVIKHFDFTIIYGHRGKEIQDKLYPNFSKVKFPDSKHNKTPSLAIDIAPYPIDWNDINRFIYLAGFVVGIANSIGIGLRWGGDWNKDTELKDNRFNDMGHFELI